MFEHEMASLLRLRYQFTKERFDADTVAAWMETSLGKASWFDARQALIGAAESGQARTIQPSDIIRRLPLRTPETPPPSWSGPVLPFAEGIAIAKASYIEQRMELGDSSREARRKADKAFRKFAETYLGDKS